MWASHTIFLTRLVLGRTIEWRAQARHDHVVSWSLATKEFWLPALLGLAPVAWLAFAAPSALPYALLIAAGPLLSIPFAALTASTRLGSALAANGLASLPEENAPPRELAALKLPAVEIAQRRRRA
jgi:membrane glycosyltransferase